MIARMYKARVDLPENNISALNQRRNKLPIFWIDQVVMSYFNSMRIRDVMGSREGRHLSVIQFPNALAIIRADSSMHSLL